MTALSTSLMLTGAGAAHAAGGGGGSPYHTDLDFATSDDVDAFTGSGITHLPSTAGPDFADGVAQVSDNSSDVATYTFDEALGTTGKTRVDLWLNVTDSQAPANTSKNGGFYLLPDSVAVASGNSAVFIGTSRNSAGGANSTTWYLTYRDDTTFENFHFVKRNSWVKIGVVLDHDANTYDIYVDGILMVRGVVFPNSSADPITRLVLLEQSLCTVLYDDIQVQTDYDDSLPTTLRLEDDFTSGSGDVGNSTPSTDSIEYTAQPWKVPDDTTTYGTFTRSANGLAPDSGDLCGAMVRGMADGTFELDWTASVSGVQHIGLMFRTWSGLASGSGANMRLEYDSSATSGQELKLMQGTTVLQQSAGTAGSVTYPGGGTHTLKVIANGCAIWCYVDDQLQFGGPHLVTSDATGARGLLSEEHCGPFFDGVRGANDNYVTAFRVKGAADTSKNITIGNRTYNLDSTWVKGFYDSDTDNPTRNWFWSKGLQPGHVSEADTNQRVDRSERLLDYPNCVVEHVQGSCWREDVLLAANSDCFFTFTRRGIQCVDALLYRGGSGTINFTPDTDLRLELWADTFRHISDSTSTSAIKGFANWATVESNKNLVGVQAVSDDATLRLSQIFYRGAGDAPNLQMDLSAKRIGNLDPFSIAANYHDADLSDGDDLLVHRLLMFETGTGLTLSAADLEGLRDDIASPATLTLGSCTLTTDTDGDTDADGFNERHGWYTLAETSAGIEITLDATARYKPQFMVTGFTGTSLTVDSVPQVEGTDYVMTSTSFGTLIEFLGTLAASAYIKFT